MIDLLIKLADLPTDLPAIQAIRRAVFQEELYKNIVLEAEMETMKLQAHIGADGMLLLQMPTDLKDTNVEVVVVVQQLPPPVAAVSEAEARYNAWGKPTTRNSISNAITRMRQLRREVALDKASIRSMIEDGRRF